MWRRQARRHRVASRKLASWRDRDGAMGPLDVLPWPSSSVAFGHNDALMPFQWASWRAFKWLGRTSRGLHSTVSMARDYNVSFRWM